MQDDKIKKEALYELLIEHIPVGVFHFDRDGIITVCNEPLERIINLPKHEIVGYKLFEIKEERILYSVKKALSGEFSIFKGEYKVSHRIIPVSVKFAPVKEQDQVIGGIAIVEDISEQVRAEQLIDHITYHDQLTNLPNRFLFLDRLNTVFQRSKKEKKKLAVVFIDLDRFKKINDSLGHEIGDQILLGLADRLSAYLDSYQNLARFGGDEFILFLPDLDSSEDAGKVAQGILKCLEEPWIIADHEFHLSASIGISLFPNDGDDIDSLIRHADIATNRAKELGRNNYQFYNPSMNKRSFEKLSLESSIRKAIDQDEFILYFQPQVDFSTKEIIGMEALIRWIHPQKGMISPAEFIPLAEESGLIVPLGKWVLNTACKQNKALQDEGYPPIRVAVNFSLTQFQQVNVVEMIKQALEDTGLEPKYLEIELTESVIIENVEETLEKIKQLKELGIHIAIDDFGTGYSSLSYLRNLLIDTLKIDRSFVRDIASQFNDAHISTAIIGLAHSLNLNVVAEGVETQEQLEFLLSKDCRKMQGYLFSKPVSLEEFKKFLLDWKNNSQQDQPKKMDIV